MIKYKRIHDTDPGPPIVVKPGKLPDETDPHIEIPHNIPVTTPRWITALKTIPYSDIILSGSWDGQVKVWRLAEDKRKIELLGALGGQEKGSVPEEGEQDEQDERNGAFKQMPQRPIDGIINDIAVFERGDRGKDGLCVVATVSSEHRLGRWKALRGVRNGGVVFEVPRVVLPSTTAAAEDNSDDETA
ncbi:hypothetical protein NQ176_g8654 [Zarea fungicola]|uniref:Uncharacterized protein n=1 Tax=Zarea fungicola TaxID=93591 RepID=A0ACC1MS17_9HYPO|nr:hypothetical protein NQ176_g8654 [Lecanicillium fungicola]